MKYIIHILSIVSLIFMWQSLHDIFGEIESLIIAVYPPEKHPVLVVDVVQSLIWITAIIYLRIGIVTFLHIEEHYGKSDKRNRQARSNS